MNKEVMHSDYDADPEMVETEKELSDYLSNIAEDIGWIVIHFNSLEDVIAQLLREMMLRDAYQDERLDVFLTEMGYQQKARALIHLYGQTEAHGACRLPNGELVQLEKAMGLAASIRNGYAHADWIGLREGAYIKVKTRSSRSGIVHRFRRIDKKTARLDLEFIISLRDRLEAVHYLIENQIYNREDSLSADGHMLPELKIPSTSESNEVRLDVQNALLALGYPLDEVAKVVQQLPSSIELRNGIKDALKILASDK
ncbi:RuvA C-terminal domain-containing protein [Undibacterium rugosum]|uniref:Holliday junction DNA helicase RuvA C-terminal domain-containing protein n=1 Tax=Undibacterium rugosum TaxID=2762291 RepID=A0A923I3P5_9BURK|nr:RuvA C-terminal domain-containing protein [Undibacterium rugosum]MBC3935469.1 hypothetical protein [Undibacterium rugosum]MBR7778756.1 hypothetical protein [Undibacterium rugosum]